MATLHSDSNNRQLIEDLKDKIDIKWNNECSKFLLPPWKFNYKNQNFGMFAIFESYISKYVVIRDVSVIISGLKCILREQVLLDS